MAFTGARHVHRNHHIPRHRPAHHEPDHNPTHHHPDHPTRPLRRQPLAHHDGRRSKLWPSRGWASERPSPRSSARRRPERSMPTGNFSRPAKLILDTKNPAYRAVAAVRSEASTYWRTVTLPFPEAGIRLLPQNSLGVFASTMATYRERGCKTPSANFLSTGGGGTSSGVVCEIPHDQRGGVSRRRGWSGPVHLGRGTGPARSRDTADHPGEPSRAGLGRKLAVGHRAGAQPLWQ
jgi:hypothetical protein